MEYNIHIQGLSGYINEDGVLNVKRSETQMKERIEATSNAFTAKEFF